MSFNSDELLKYYRHLVPLDFKIKLPTMIPYTFDDAEKTMSFYSMKCPTCDYPTPSNVIHSCPGAGKQEPVHHVDVQTLEKRHSVLFPQATVVITAAEIRRAIREAVIGERVRCIDIVRANLSGKTEAELVMSKILGNEKRPGMYGCQTTREELKSKIEKAFPKLSDVKVDDTVGDASVLITAKTGRENIWPHTYSSFYSWLDTEAPTDLHYQVKLSWR